MCIHTHTHTHTHMQENLSEEVKQELKEIEEEQSFEELAVLRTLVMNCIKKERDLAEVSYGSSMDSL